LATARRRLRLSAVTSLTRLLILLLVIVIVGCGREPTLVAAPAAGELRLWEDAAIFDSVRTVLGEARRLVWVEMYEFDRPDLAAALARARARGVDVRLIVDPSVSVSVRTARGLAGLGLAVRYYPLDDRRHQIDHVKLLLTDSEAVAGGMNWGRHSDRNHDYALEIRPPPLLARLRAIFEQDWSLAGGVPARLPPAGGAVAQTAPGAEIRQALEGALAAARRTVFAEVFVLTDGDVIAGLAAAVRRGATVRVLLDARQDVNRPGYTLLRASGVAVRWYRPPPGAKLHAKIGSFDGRLVLGSANWSLSGLSVNHELDVVTDDPAVTAAFRARFDADWSSVYAA
jgi:phosphatidylserine/phosphatidylglycerophosphate/cardiolipin synthase-like enzyme